MVGFAGVLLVTRPGVGDVHWAAFYSVASAVFYALYIVATRVLSTTDTTDTTLFYSNLVGAVAMLPVLPFVWTTPDDPWIIFLMVAFGAFGSFGHYLLIVAHRLAPASVLAPFMYSQLDLGDRLRLFRVRRCAQPLDACRRRGGGRVRALSSAS